MRLTTDGTDITDPNFTTKSTKHTELGDPQIETRSAPALLGATHRAFTFYLADPISSIETRLFPNSLAATSRLYLLSRRSHQLDCADFRRFRFFESGKNGGGG